MPTDPRYSLLGTVDPSVAQTADNFYAGIPDTSWLQARGVMPTQSMNQGYPPQQGAWGSPQTGVPQQNPWNATQQAYEKNIVSGIQGFDITKPDYQQKVQDYFLNHQDPNASQYPRVQAEVNAALNTHKELKSYIQKNPKAAETYGNLIKQGYSQEDAIGSLREQTARDADNQKQALELAKHGLDHTDYQDKNGNIDPIAAAKGIFQAQQANQFTRTPVNDKEIAMLNKAEDSMNEAKASPPADDKEYTAQKQAYIAANPGADWTTADKALTAQRVGSAQKQYQKVIQTLHQSNRAVPPLDWESAGLQAPSYDFNTKGKGRMGGGPQGSTPYSPFGAPSTFNPDTGTWSGQQPVAALVPPGAAPTIVPTGAAPQILPENSSQLPTMGLEETKNLLEANKAANQDTVAKGLTDQAWTDAKGKIKDLVDSKWTDPQERLQKLISVYKVSKGLTDLGSLKNIHGFDPEAELGPDYANARVQYPEALKDIPIQSLSQFPKQLARVLTGSNSGGIIAGGTPRDVLFAHAQDELKKQGYLNDKGEIISPTFKAPMQPGQTIQVAPGITIANKGK